MGKAPAFQFYVGDWIQDTRILTPSSRGIWADLLCFMWRAEERGQISGTYPQLARLLSASESEIKDALHELSVTKVADVTERNEIVTITNRRMFREERERVLTRKRVKRFRNGEVKRDCNDDVTPPSSSSSSTSSSDLKYSCATQLREHFEKFWEVYPKKKSKGQAEKAWNAIKPDEQLVAIMIATIERAKKTADWQKDGGQFIPYPATWLRAKGWEDEFSQGEENGKRKSIVEEWAKERGITISPDISKRTEDHRGALPSPDGDKRTAVNMGGDAQRFD